MRSNREFSKRLPEAQLLPGQPKILEFLLTHNGCTQREISEGCILDKSTVTSLLKRMEQTSLIDKKAHPQDQRASLIFLTPTGKQKALWVKEQLTVIDEAELQNIPELERQQFLLTLEKIIQKQKTW